MAKEQVRRVFRERGGLRGILSPDFPEEGRKSAVLSGADPVVGFAKRIPGSGRDPRVTARQNDRGARMVPARPADGGPAVPVGPVGDRAAVDDDDVGIAVCGDNDFEPGGDRFPDDGGGIGEVRLAADGYDR